MQRVTRNCSHLDKLEEEVSPLLRSLLQVSGDSQTGGSRGQLQHPLVLSLFACVLSPVHLIVIIGLRLILAIIGVGLLVLSLHREKLRGYTERERERE